MTDPRDYLFDDLPPRSKPMPGDAWSTDPSFKLGEAKGLFQLPGPPPPIKMEHVSPTKAINAILERYRNWDVAQTNYWYGTPRLVVKAEDITPQMRENLKHFKGYETPEGA